MSFEGKFNDFLTKIQEDPILSSKLTSTSSASVYRIMGAVFSRISQDFEDAQEMKVFETSSVIQKQRAWSYAEYEARALAFQYGDQPTDPTLSNLYRQYYEVVDESKKIVKFVKVSEGLGQVFLKIGKSVDNLPSPLTEDELNSFVAYMDEIGEIPNFLRTPAGDTNITSTEGDNVLIGFKAYLDPTKYIVNSSDPDKNGQNILTGVKDVEVAIKEAIIQEITFGGDVKISQIEAKVFNIVGVLNFVVTIAVGKKFDNTGTIDILAETTRSYSPYAGYVAEVVIDPSSEYLKG